MAGFVLSCCSTADMTKDYFEKRDIRYICFHYTISGETYPDDLGVTMSFDTFYKRLSDGEVSITSQVNVDEYTNYFEEFLKQGKDVLHLTLSSGISGTYNSAMIASNELSKKYPDRKLYVVDSRSASSGYGLLMDMLADKRDEGFDIDRLRDYAENSKLNVNHWFFSMDLTSFLRGGRISKTQFRVGRVLNICPLLRVDAEGKLVTAEKIRTKKKTMEAIVSGMEENALDGKHYGGKVFISHSDCYSDAKKLAEMIEARFGNMKEKVKINTIGTVIGSHTGRGTVAVFYVGRKRE